MHITCISQAYHMHITCIADGTYTWYKAVCGDEGEKSCHFNACMSMSMQMHTQICEWLQHALAFKNTPIVWRNSGCAIQQLVESVNSCIVESVVFVVMGLIY